MKITKKTFGILSTGKKVRIYTLKAGDLTLSLSTLGATWTCLTVPSREKGTNDILLGYSTLDSYINNPPFIGVTVGRFANRIGKAKFSLDGKEFLLNKNDGENTLHGGKIGLSRQIWKADAYEEKDGVFVRFELKSPSGDEGYPGNMRAVVSYGLTKSNELVASYEAKLDAPCPVNFTNHAYFNLAGEERGLDILSTEIKLFCSSYLDVDNALIPTGKILSTDKTPFDFKTRKPIGKDINPLIQTSAKGYDHCFIVDGEPGKLRPFAEVYEPLTGRSMRGYTTQPSVQLYTGNQITAVQGKNGSVYKQFGGFCMETQHFPDSPNKPDFPSAIFGPGRDYHEKAVFAFDW